MEEIQQVEETIVVTRTRPLAITVLCAYSFVQWALLVVSLIIIEIFSKISPKVTGLTPDAVFSQVTGALLGISLNTWSLMVLVLIIAFISGIVGYWFMQRWSVIIYAAATVALAIFMQHSVVTWSIDVIYTFIVTFVYPVAVLVVGGVYFKKMK